MRHVSDSAVSLLARNHEVTYVTNYDSAHADTVKLTISLNPLDARNWRSLVRLSREIKARKPDTVHINSGHPMLAPLYPFLGRYNTTMTIHDARAHAGERLVKRFFHPVHVTLAALFIPKFIVPSEATRASLPSAVRRKPVFVVPLYFDFSDLKPTVPERRIGQPFRLLFFGRLLSYKGIDTLVRAFAGLPMDKFELLIAGEGPAAPKVTLPNMTVINRYIEDEEMGPILDATDAIVLSHHSMSQSGVLPFAVHFHRPVIATDTGNMSEEYLRGNVAELVRPGSVDELRSAMLRLAAPENYREALMRMGRSGTVRPEMIRALSEAVYGFNPVIS